MGSTHGRRRLPLPPSLRDGLTSLGFIETVVDTDPGVHRWRHPGHPTIQITLVASNIPGSTAVTYQRETGKVGRFEADAVLVDVAIDIAQLNAPTGRSLR